MIDGVLNITAANTKLSYLQTLTEYLENYKTNRNYEIEELYEYCADKQIDTFTISLAKNNLSAIKSIYESIQADASAEEKLNTLKAELIKLNK